MCDGKEPLSVSWIAHNCSTLHLSAYLRLGREGISLRVHYPGIQDHSRKKHTLSSNLHGTAFYRIRSVWGEIPHLCVPFPSGLVLHQEPNTAPGRHGGAESGWLWACPGEAASGLVPCWPHHRNTCSLLGFSKSITSAVHTHTGQAGPAHRKRIQCWGGSYNKVHKQLWQCNQKGCTALVCFPQQRATADA